MARKKRKDPDPKKSRAGKLGARARWLGELEQHRALERLRDGFVRDHWRLKLRHLMFRYLFLYWGMGRRITETERIEQLEQLWQQTKPGVSLGMISGMARYTPPGQSPYWSWSRADIATYLEVTKEVLAPGRNDRRSAGKTTALGAGFSVSRYAGAAVGERRRR